jgi:anti-anti-sigma factor
VTLHRPGDAIVAEISGEVDLLTAPLLKASMTHVLMETPATLVVDLANVGFLSAAGLAVLADLPGTAGPQTAVRVIAAQRAVVRPMQIFGLFEELSVYRCRADALAGG